MGVHLATQTCWLKHLTCRAQPLTVMATVAPMALEALRRGNLEVSKGVRLGASMGLSREPSMGRGVSLGVRLGVSNQQVGAGNHVKQTRPVSCQSAVFMPAFKQGPIWSWASLCVLDFPAIQVCYTASLAMDCARFRSQLSHRGYLWVLTAIASSTPSCR